MREFLVESALPFLGVGGLVLGLTFALFDVPDPPLAPARVAPRTQPAEDPRAENSARIPRSASPPAADETVPSPSRSVPLVRDRLNEILGRTLQQVNAGRPRAQVAERRPSSAGELGGTKGAPPANPPPDPGLFGAVTAIGEAVKAVREARTEEDIVRAEESVRGVREKMEAACQAGGAASPLCEGAAQIRTLGY